MLSFINEILEDDSRLAYFVNLDPVDDIPAELDVSQSVNDTVTVSYK